MNDKAFDWNSYLLLRKLLNRRRIQVKMRYFTPYSKSRLHQHGITILAWTPQVSVIRFVLALLTIISCKNPVISKTVKLYDKYYLLGEKTLDNMDSAILYLQKKQFHFCHPSLLGLRIAQGMLWYIRMSILWFVSIF